MADCDCITMIKYQGLGNDYLVLDPNKNRIQLQGKKIALLCQRGFGLGADGTLWSGRHQWKNGRSYL